MNEFGFVNERMTKALNGKGKFKLNRYVSIYCGLLINWK